MTVLLALGTAKGLFLARSDDRSSWEVSGPHFPMTGVYGVCFDKRRATPRLLAGVTSSHYGPSLAYSDDLGVSWHEPEHPPVAFPQDTGRALERVWQIVPDPFVPDRVWAGTEPSALFVSDDGGVTFEMVRSLWDHPHRPEWQAGFGGQAVHTILPHPDEPSSLLVAMSTGGVYRSTDSGASWAPANSGIQATFMPDRFPEFGQCVHKVTRDAADPERLYAQNHHGVYRSDDGGTLWESIAEGLPSDFGFAIVAHPTRPDVVYNFPLAADAMRFPPDARCRVYRSQDAGKSWEALSDGLPSEPFYPSVLRDAMCADDADPAGVYFGTRSGEVYASRDEGDSWTLVASHLPDVLCVRAAVV
ncbi:glycosyl hydrolase [Sphaerisporangium melleum]|uniref:Glycosyl hydrolase n=1 Tax=Sphaerisporangium melleum TaxID=321316 RepID=A0A917RFN9_9ACTN|nr:exo-alpha-sialidase [Sphaerisporangium melleum]GGL05824.1 glycosyl hydrolase [Sphaerisporangium melleum]GII73158.1 glycosyl hydrolase [Sphaerisporangium melleum]